MPHNEGAPLARKEPSLSLLLNFSPIEIEDVEIEVGLLPYGADGQQALKQLRQEHWSTHVFRREGADHRFTDLWSDHQIPTTKFRETTRDLPRFTPTMRVSFVSEEMTY